MREGKGAARRIVAKLNAGRLPDGFKARDIGQAGWAGLTDDEEIKRALDLLEDFDWVRGVASPKRKQGGRPTVSYQINPHVRREARA